MPMTPWGYGGFGNGGGEDPRRRQQQQPAPAMPAAQGGGAPPPAAWGGGGMGMNPWLQGLAQRIAQARQQWQQRMPQHPMGGGWGGREGMGEHGGMGMPWMHGGPPQGAPQSGAMGAPPAAGGPPPAAAAPPGAGMLAPGWSNRFAAPAAGAQAAPAGASPVKPEAQGDSAPDGDPDDEKKDE